MSGVANDGLSVELDGKPVPNELLGEAIPVNPGHRTVVLRARGLPAVVRGFTASERQTSEIDVVVARGATAVPVEEDRSHVWVPAGIAFGVGFAGLTLGVVAGALHLARASDLQDRCPDDRCAPELEPERDTITTLGIVSLVGLGVAAAGAGVGIAIVIVDAADEGGTSTALHLAPGAVGVLGSF
jgi:hypothetical protein